MHTCRLHEATAQFRQRRASGGSQHPSNGTESVSAIAAPVTMGLKEFSRAVWYKVMEKRETDYHEVPPLNTNACVIVLLDPWSRQYIAIRFVLHVQMAEEMLRDMDADGAVGHGTSSTGSKVQNPLDERNVRRRVYDALNVMMAVGVIEKDTAARKILWKGFAPKARDQTDGLEVCGFPRVATAMLVSLIFLANAELAPMHCSYPVVSFLLAAEGAEGAKAAIGSQEESSSRSCHATAGKQAAHPTQSIGSSAFVSGWTAGM